MNTFELSLLPTAVDITLYKYNYIDNKIWTQIQNDVEFIQNPDDSIMISVNQLKYLLDKYYISTINKIKTQGSDVIHKEINTVYFLYQMAMEMKNLQYIKFTINTDKSYSRLIQVDGKKVLQFGFKVITATLRLSDLYDDDELPMVNKVLNNLGIISESSNYTRIFASELASKIDTFLQDIDEDDFDSGIVADILDVLEGKLEPENTLLLLITDY
jgi:hypothetical protein